MGTSDARVRRPAMYEYRCKLCGTIEPADTQAEARALRDSHRDEVHGPDEIVEVPRIRFVDLPRNQQVATVVVALVLLVGILVKTN
jgi:hypothetical protein